MFQVCRLFWVRFHEHVHVWPVRFFRWIAHDCMTTDQNLSVFPECAAKGSRLPLEVWGLESCSPSVVSTTATVRRVFAVRARSVTVGRRTENVLTMTCSRSISSQIACFCCVLWYALRWRLRFVWQAQYFGSVSMLACRFLVARIAESRVAIYRVAVL